MKTDSNCGGTSLRELPVNGDSGSPDRIAGRWRQQKLAPPTVVVFARLLIDFGKDKQGLQLLMEAQRQHPADFWINFGLAQAFSEQQPPNLDERLRFETAAVALRPTSVPAHNNSACALWEKGRLGGGHRCLP